MDEQELNKKLAEWAGFKRARSILGNWKDPAGFYVDSPNFTQSLDDCFKWLVPKLVAENSWNIKLYYTPSFPKLYHFKISDSLNREPHYQAQAESPALPLCLAIEKLIDSEKG